MKNTGKGIVPWGEIGKETANQRQLTGAFSTWASRLLLSVDLETAVTRLKDKWFFWARMDASVSCQERPV